MLATFVSKIFLTSHLRKNSKPETKQVSIEISDDARIVDLHKSNDPNAEHALNLLLTSLFELSLTLIFYYTMKRKETIWKH